MKKLLALVVVGAAASVALTGCSALKDSVTNRHELAFHDYAEADAQWKSLPSWVPTDATSLRLRETTDAPIAVAQVLSATDPVGCEKGDRTYLPGIGGDWIPTDFPHTVWLCGDWEVMSINGGWVGWTIDQNKMTGDYAPVS